MNDHKRLAREVERDLERLREQERHPATWTGLLLYGGTLGLLFVLPIVGGAYLGRWLDALFPGYSVRWTVSLIVLGIAVGFWNVVRFIRDKT